MLSNLVIRKLWLVKVKKQGLYNEFVSYVSRRLFSSYVCDITVMAIYIKKLQQRIKISQKRK